MIDWLIHWLIDWLIDSFVLILFGQKQIMVIYTVFYLGKKKLVPEALSLNN